MGLITGYLPVFGVISGHYGVGVGRQYYYGVNRVLARVVWAYQVIEIIGISGLLRGGLGYIRPYLGREGLDNRFWGGLWG